MAEVKINQKGKLGQFFCRHHNQEWLKKIEKYHNLSGDTHYLICKDCGKELDTRFISHD